MLEPVLELNPQEQRLRYLKQQDQRQQWQASEQETLRRLQENAEGQEVRLRKVRALKGQVEQKRLGNGKLGERQAVQILLLFSINTFAYSLTKMVTT